MKGRAMAEEIILGHLGPLKVTLPHEPATGFKVGRFLGIGIFCLSIIMSLMLMPNGLVPKELSPYLGIVFAILGSQVTRWRLFGPQEKFRLSIGRDAQYSSNLSSEWVVTCFFYAFLVAAVFSFILPSILH
jgi:hypothetical protein